MSETRRVKRRNLRHGGLGVVIRHSRQCGSGKPTGAVQGCTCKPTYEAWFYADVGRKRRKSFRDFGEAQDWRAQQLAALAKARHAEFKKRDPNAADAYSLIRKTAQILQWTVDKGELGPLRDAARAALASIYEAEDALVLGLKGRSLDGSPER